MMALTRVRFQYHVQSGHITHAIKAGRTKHLSEMWAPDFRFKAQKRETEVVHFPVINDVSNASFERHQPVRPVIEGAIWIAKGVITNTAHLQWVYSVDESNEIHNKQLIGFTESLRTVSFLCFCSIVFSAITQYLLKKTTANRRRGKNKRAGNFSLLRLLFCCL